MTSRSTKKTELATSTQDGTVDDGLARLAA
jgi:hypothetical protein